MKRFCDKTGQAWDVSITFDVLEAVKDQAGICLIDLTQEDRAAKRSEADAKRLNDDRKVFISVLYVLCEKQVKDRSITPEGFAELWNEWGAYSEAVLAVDEEFTLFCLPSSKKDKGRRALAERARAMESVTDKALDTMERIATDGPNLAGSTSLTS